jgi:lactate 2-monooxygenase
MMEAYLGGLMGQKPAAPYDLDALEAIAKAKMSPEAYGYVAGGAGRESTIANNRNALDRVRIVPRMLRGVAERDIGRTLYGRRLAAPVFAAPIGVQEMAHPEADKATARACAKLGVPMIISNQASVPIEAIAAEMGDAPRWFQLYWGRSDELAASLVARAEACGCEAIVITLDTHMLGWRVRDMDHGFLPFLKGMGIAQYTSDPVFRAMLAEPPEANIQAAALLFTQIYSDPSLDWARLAFLRERTKLPILLKGVQDPIDASKALDCGMDGLIVSNHGGRQVDGAIGSADALVPIVAAIGGRAPVLFDSGIRGGADIFKALALGADAVLVGRPYIWGLAAAGQEGVEAVFKNMLAELDLTMGLAGCASLAEVDRGTIDVA